MNFFDCMKPALRVLAVCSLLSTSLGLSAYAQDDAAKKEAEKQLYEAIDKEVTRLTNLLELEDWQAFYVDSILTHDYNSMQEELTELSSKKVSNTDMYLDVQYKWMDKMYYAYEKIFDPEQWAKYLKNGAARDKKTRDKHMAKSGK